MKSIKEEHMLVRQRTFTPLFDRNVDRAFEQLANSFFQPRPAGPVVDGSWQDDEYVLTVDLPGVPAENVDVQVADRVLEISATIDSTDWHRSIRLGSRLDPEQVSARHVDGRLTIRIGQVAGTEARRVAIDTSERDAIEATSSDAQESTDTTDAG